MLRTFSQVNCIYKKHNNIVKYVNNRIHEKHQCPSPANCGIYFLRVINFVDFRCILQLIQIQLIKLLFAMYLSGSEQTSFFQSVEPVRMFTGFFSGEPIRSVFSNRRLILCFNNFVFKILHCIKYLLSSEILKI